MAFKKRIESLTKEEQEERYMRALRLINPERKVINLFTLFVEANPDIDINVGEFREWLKTLKK